MTGAPSDHGTLLPGTPSQTPAERSNGENAGAHTPGPWTAELGRWSPDAPVAGFRVHREGALRNICDNNMGDPGDGKERFLTAEELTANARLIAAAPDLLDSIDADTLEAIADEIDCFEHSARAGTLRSLARRQRAAITKAQVQS